MRNVEILLKVLVSLKRYFGGDKLVNIDELIEFVTPYYQNKDIMHNLSHIERVLKCANRLSKQTGVNVNIDAITYAAYFHGFVYNEEEKISKWLEKKLFLKDNIKFIIKISWESLKEEMPETFEGKILHDAHMIEGGRTYLVVKSLITGSVRGQTLEQTIDYIEKNILEKGSCYLEESKLAYQQQQIFAKQFIKDLKEGLE